MLLGAVTVFVAVASSTGDRSATDESITALDRSLHAALGPDASVTVTAATSADDATSRARDEAAHATLVSVVTLDSSERATIRFVRANDGTWSEREIRFDPHDAPRERGRTIGFALASVVPDEPSRARPEPEPNRAPSTTTPKVVTRHGPPPRMEHSPWLEAVGMIAAGIDGYGGGAGGSIAMRFHLLPGVRVRLGAGIRAGEVAPAQATSQTYLAAAGLSYAIPIDGARRLYVGARVDALLIVQELAHLSTDDPVLSRQFKGLPGADASAEASWHFLDKAALVGGVGAEVAFGSADIFVKNQPVATLSPARLTTELGLRVLF